MKKVIIIGGGVAGMSAAHELAERGFEVHVYEKNPEYPGGKARSTLVEGTSINGSEMLPGEHGFRFFPRFYKHLPDTMKRIPYKNNKNGVEDNLVETSRMMICSNDQPPIVGIDRFPRDLDDLKTIFSEAHAQLGLAQGELDFFAGKLWQIITSCKLRRERDYESISWWDFVDAAQKSEAYQNYLATGLTRTLVALQAPVASTKTGGDILAQLIFDVATPGMSSDRVLNGPTNEVWINPWLEYLKSLGVQYHLNAKATAIGCSNGMITNVSIMQGDQKFDVSGDYYIMALPVDIMATLLNKEIIKSAPSLHALNTLKNDVAWMTGIQFYLNEDIELTHGHNIFIDSPWAVTAISQKQFWPNTDFSKMYDGTVKTILSVDVSDWNQKVELIDPVTGKKEKRSANECSSKDEIAYEVWRQLKQAINRPGKEILKDENKVLYNLDKDIDILRPGDLTNAEPLLINKITTWYQRPEAYTQIPNMFLASDYVKTNTDLATMEGANEAARRAVNSIIDASGSNAHYCEIWDLHEPDIFAPWRAHDQARFDKGMPWNGDIFDHTLLEEAAESIGHLITSAKKRLSLVFGNDKKE
jgi:15-cis-phytoene desaturase